MSTTATTKTLPSVNRKAYDGSLIVTYTIKPGETLQAIAAIYGFANWKPIWIYNTGLCEVTGSLRS